MKYKSFRWQSAIITILMMLYLGTNGMAAVRAESAQTLPIEVEREEKATVTGHVPVLGQSSGVGSAEITATEGRKMDGIYYTGFSINGQTGYCLQSSRDTPEDAVYDVEQELNAGQSFLAKVMYYAYGSPGYRPELWVPDCPQDTERAYLRSHLVLSYIYDEGNTLDREVKDPSWVPWWKNYIAEAITRIQNEADVPQSGLALSSGSEEAYFDRGSGKQRTDNITLLGDTRNQITLKLPEGVILVNETGKVQQTESAVLHGGDTFYFMAEVSNVSGQVFVSGDMYGTVTNDWAALIIKTGPDTQDMGMGVLYPSKENRPISLSVRWIPAPELDITKNADREEKKYKKGELITYTLEITQKVPKTAAKNVVIEDCILTEGVKLQKNSVVLLDEDKKVIKDAKITVQGNSIHIEGGEKLGFLECVEDGHRLFVEYQALIISDEMDVVENIAKVRSDNTPEVPAEEEVEIEKPKEPEVPKPEEPKKEVPQKVKEVKTQRVATGDTADIFFPFAKTACALTAVFTGIFIRRHRGKRG